MNNSTSTSPKKDDTAIATPAAGSVAGKKEEAVKATPSINDKK